VEEYDGNDFLLRKFVYGQRIDEIRVMIAPDYADVDDDQDTTEILHFYYHHDMLGTVTHVTDENENVAESYVYSPYGQTTIKDIGGSTISNSALENPYIFTARRMDESTGLYHYRRRAYDPERGRFLQRDPLGYVGGMARHSYVESGPTRFVDPIGLEKGEVHTAKAGGVTGTRDQAVAAAARAVAAYGAANKDAVEYGAQMKETKDTGDARSGP